MTGPKLSDRAAVSAAALQSAAAHDARAAELRALGNEEHARDYDAMAARARARAAEYDEPVVHATVVNRRGGGWGFRCSCGEAPNRSSKRRRDAESWAAVHRAAATS